MFVLFSVYLRSLNLYNSLLVLFAKTCFDYLCKTKVLTSMTGLGTTFLFEELAKNDAFRHFLENFNQSYIENCKLWQR